MERATNNWNVSAQAFRCFDAQVPVHNKPGSIGHNDRPRLPSELPHRLKDKLQVLRVAPDAFGVRWEGVRRDKQRFGV